MCNEFLLLSIVELETDFLETENKLGRLSEPIVVSHSHYSGTRKERRFTLSRVSIYPSANWRTSSTHRELSGRRSPWLVRFLVSTRSYPYYFVQLERTVQQRHSARHGGFTYKKDTLLVTMGFHATKARYSTRNVSLLHGNSPWRAIWNVSLLHGNLPWRAICNVSLLHGNPSWWVMCLYCTETHRGE